MKNLNIVTIGGGTGSFVILKALKRIKNINISAIVTTADSGGIAKKERDEFGILPQSDIRKAIIALARDNEDTLVRKIFTYRFSKGIGLEGVTLGNLILAALTDIENSQYKAILKTQELLDIRGKVLPITLDTTNILVTLENNQQVLGEVHLDNVFWDGTKKVENVELIPRAKIHNEARKAIKNADFIIIPPGDLFGSIIVNFIVEGFNEALNKSNAKLIYVSNLFTKFGQSYNFTVSDHIKELEKYLNRKLDIVFVNNSSFSKEILQKYAKEKAVPVKYDLDKLKKYKIIEDNFVNGEIQKKKKGDKIKRSLIRHNIDKLYNKLDEIFKD